MNQVSKIHYRHRLVEYTGEGGGEFNYFVCGGALLAL